jgi:hypothetical protein
MRQRLAAEYAKPVPAIGTQAAKFYQECCDSAFAATAPDWPRVRVDMWAQAERAHRDYVTLKAKTEKPARDKRDRRVMAFTAARPHVFIAESDTTVPPLVIRKPHHV